MVVVGGSGGRVWLRTVAITAVLALVAVACGSGDGNPSATLVETTSPPDSVAGAEVVVPEPSVLIIDEDPASLVAATVLYEPGGHLIEKVDFLGPKPSSNLPPTAALVYLVGFDEAIRIDFDSAGRPAVMYLGRVGELRFRFAGSTLTAQYVAPDGTTSSEDFPLAAGGDTAAQSASEFEAGAVVFGGSPADYHEAVFLDRGGQTSTGEFALAAGAGTALHSGFGRFAGAGNTDGSLVELRRAVFFDAVVWSEETLPAYLAEPYARINGCFADRNEAHFTCHRLAAQPLTSDETSRMYRLGLTHEAEMFVEGLSPSVWPSAQACEQALGNDWWIDAGLTVGLETSAQSLAVPFLTWLKAEATAAAATSAAAVEGFLPGVAIAATVAISFWAGNWVGEQLFEGGEGGCENIKRRVLAVNLFAKTVRDIDFTIEVCMPPTPGWTVDADCKDVGPYQPFSELMSTNPGDPDTLDRNRLPAVEFVMSPSPGAVSGRVVDAASGDPVEGAGVVLSPSGPQTTTDATGRFDFAGVPAGAQTVVVSATGFAETTTSIQVETDQTTQATISLERSDDLPWRFAGPATFFYRGTFASGGTGTLERPIDLEITLQSDGRIDAVMQFSGVILTLNCAEETVYGFEGDPPPPNAVSGTYSDGSFEIGAYPITGTYTSKEIRGEVPLVSSPHDCDGKAYELSIQLLPFVLPRVDAG